MIAPAPSTAPGSGAWSAPSPPVAAFLTTRLLLWVSSYVGLTVVPLTRAPKQWQAFPDCAWLDGWARWDSGWLMLFVNGYMRSARPPTNVAWLPLYPFLTLFVSLPFRLLLTPERAFVVAGILVSNAAFLIGLIGLFRLGESTIGRIPAGRAVWAMALFPFSFFFTAVYTDAVYFAAIVWTFYWAASGRWLPAACAAGLASICRLPGVLILPIVIYEYMRQRRFQWRRIDRGVWVFALMGVPLACTMGFFLWRYGDPLVSFHIHERSWGRVWSWRHIPDAGTSLLRHFDLLNAIYLFLILAALGLLIECARRLGSSQTLFLAASLIVAVGTGLEGTGRFMAVMFPLFLALALLTGRRPVWIAVCALCVPTLLWAQYRFAHWGWIT